MAKAAATTKKTTKTATATKTVAKKAVVKSTAVKAKPAPVAKTKTVKAAAIAPKTVAKAVVKAAPAPTPAPKAVARPMTTSRANSKTPQTKTSAVNKTMTSTPANKNSMDFNVGDYVVYPTHGVGTVDSIETAKIGGMEVTMYKIMFKHDRMILRVPTLTAKAKGLRKLASGDRLQEAMTTLKGRARIKRTMWSRRAQEYESKINSGDPVAIAEVLRDLKRSNDEVEQSFSERQIYQSALSRLAREVAAVENLTETDASAKLEKLMGKVKKDAANDQLLVA